MVENSSATDAGRIGQTLGALLAAARDDRGIPLEQAARETRIRVQRLREIEADDFSHFTHPSYARLFLVDYARYLDIPVSKIRALLPDRGECGTEGYQYLEETAAGVGPCIVRRIRSRRRFMPIFALAAFLLVCALGGVQLWITLRNIDRLGEGRLAGEEKVEMGQPSTGSGFAADKEALDLPPPQASAEPVKVDVMDSASDQASLFAGEVVDQTGRVQ